VAKRRREALPEFYKKLLDRYNINPATAIFIDDNPRNVKARRAPACMAFISQVQNN
jgi:HAD superfamily hydrolase (TIGR01509 family)